jgi:glycolate oxidase
VRRASAYRELPLAVALPSTVEQVQQVVRLCREHGVPIDARGAGLLSLARLKSILDTDPSIAPPGCRPEVRNLAISRAAERHGLFYAPDPSS